MQTDAEALFRNRVRCQAGDAKVITHTANASHPSQAGEILTGPPESSQTGEIRIDIRGNSLDKINGQRTSSPGSPAQDSETNPKKSSKWQKFKALFHRQKAPVTPHKAVNSTQKPSGIEKIFSSFFQGKSQAKSHVCEQNHKDRNISNITNETSRIGSPQPAIEGQTFPIQREDDNSFEKTFSDDSKKKLKESVEKIFHEFLSKENEHPNAIYKETSDKNQIQKRFHRSKPVGQKISPLFSPVIKGEVIHAMCDRHLGHAFDVYSRLKNKNEVFSDEDKERTINALKFFESFEGKATSDQDLNETVNILTSALNNALEIIKKTSEEKNLQASAPPSKTQVVPTPEITWKTARKPDWETAPNPAMQLSSSRTYSDGFFSLATRLSAKNKTTTPHEEITLPTIFSSKVSAPPTEKKLPHLHEIRQQSKPRHKNKENEEAIEEIVKNTPAPIYFQEDYQKDSPETKAAEVPVPEEKYAKLHRDRAYMATSDYQFARDIENIGTLLLQPSGQFIAPRDLNETKILRDAFQIYYEEGIKAYPNSFAHRLWTPTKASFSLEDLSTLLTNLEKISSWNTNTQELIEKAKVTLRARIHGSR